jgi:spermidine synthase
MSDHETLIMQKSAEVICQNGGSILNVGFGMGIIDSFIRDLNPAEHTIVDIHPRVIEKAKELGFDKTATLCLGDWRFIVEYWKKTNKKFDGIYFDTISMISNEWLDFVKEVDHILSPGGTFAYFNHVAAFIEDNDLPKYIQENYGYKFHSKKIQFTEILDTLKVDYDDKLLNKEDYNLVWFTKNK